MAREKVNAFGKLGQAIIKRKYIIIVAWILLLAILLPVILSATGISSLEMTSVTNSNLESTKASNIIAAQFSSTVPNNTLVVVISTNNASSIETQQFINKLTTDIATNSSVAGAGNITSIYSILAAAINGTNDSVYTAYDSANQTYYLLYGTPAAYETVWSTAYNQTINSTLVPALNETNQAVFGVLYNANMTYNLLYGVPAIYLNAWLNAYNQTQSVSISNDIAYNDTATMLNASSPTTFNQSLPILNIFNDSWSSSFQDPTMQQYTPLQRAEVASNQTNQMYIDDVLSDNSSAQEFVGALTNTFTLQDFLTNSQAQNDVEIQNFSIQFVAESSNASDAFVGAAYSLGVDPDSGALRAMATNIIWNPQSYGMGQDFILTFNTVAYNETAAMLNETDSSAFSQYTSHLLDLFNASWCQTFNQTTENWNATYRTTVAADQAIPEFISTYLSSSAFFAEGVANTLSLQDFLSGNTTLTNIALQDFAISYVSNASGLTTQFVNTVFNLGQSPDSGALQTLASNIVYNPDAYNVGSALNATINSLVSPSKNVTLVSVSLNESSNSDLLAIRGIISSELSQNPGDVKSALVTGSQAIQYDYMQSTNHDLDIILPFTIILLLIATGLFFRSPITPLITLGTIGIGLGIAQIFPILIGTYVNKIDSMIPTILLTVMLGVGTDYGIFIIARHREERINGLSVREAIVKSITWAGESITTSGMTVIISFLSLSAASLILLQTLGLVVGLGVIVALAVSLTFIPAIVAILGDRIFWPNSGERFKRHAQSALERKERKKGYFARSGAFAVKHAKVIVIAAVLITVPLVYVYSTTTPTYNFLGGAPSNLDSIIASKTLTSSFGSGTLFPTYVVVTFSQPLVENGTFNAGEMAILQNMSSELAARSGVQEVTGPTMPYGSPISYMSVNSSSGAMTYSSILQSIGADNKTALISIKFQDNAYSTKAIDEAQDIRTILHENFDNSTGVTGIYVGGTTGSLIDTKNVFVSQLDMILLIVAICVMVLLFFVLGSLFLSIFAVISVLMSIVWTLAVTALVFQSSVFNSFGLLFITPLVLFVLLLGIGMDYNIFILTRIREEASKGVKQNEAIAHAIQQAGGVITAAAIILAGSLGSLMLSSNIVLQELGFAFLFSILIDALVIQTYLVPAVMSILGKWNWYTPIKRLRRVKDFDGDSA